MKWLWFGAALIFFGGLFARPHHTQATKGITVLVGGSTDGYLSPCGCTKPMSGGIRRRVTAVRQLAKGGKAVILENGGFVSGIGRQDEMKAETISESLKSVGVTAVNLTTSEAALGPAMISTIQRLSGDALVSGSVEGSPTAVVPLKASAPFLIGAGSMKAEAIATALGGRPRNIERVAEDLSAQAAENELIPVLMLDGNREQARDLARKYPKLALIVFRSSGDPPNQAETEGGTWLVTPGEHGKFVVRLTYDKAFGGYSVVRLGPEVGDDPTAGRAYDRYLDRVGREQLLEKLPRLPGKAFSGSERCGTCHSEALAIWKSSGHSHALTTLEKERHDRDPDCVGCHTVGLDVDTGFKTRASTPDLASVGCESCHGAGEEHSKDPKVKMGKVGEQVCLRCHTKENSPTFDFKSYWAKVIHK
jgi:hypothetical protein